VIVAPRLVDILHFHLFCGLGGGAEGFNEGEARVGHLQGRFRCIGGIDSDAAAIADFDSKAKARGTVLDLFSERQYRDFHGKGPGPGWREATPADIRRAANGERPHIVFGSAPCKGFSGLLSEKQSKTTKYKALNGLALRALRLTLEAWQDDPPEFWLWENVPRIQTRGAAVLTEMRELLEKFGYATQPSTHDCGELGELGQHRNRFLLVARHREKVPPFLYQPRKRRVRSVGEVLSGFPLPDDPTAGPMHEMRRLQWKTWVRLAFVKAGGDWRSLKDLRVENGVLKDFALVPAGCGALGVTDWNAPARGRNDSLGVVDWQDPAGTVTGEGYPTNGRFCVADPRTVESQVHSQRGVLGVNAWDAPTGAVAGRNDPTNGKFSVADPRPGFTSEYGQYGVKKWDETAGTVSGQCEAGGGAYSVADPRYEKFGQHHGKMRVEEWDGPSHTITGSDRVGSGALSVADPRPDLREQFGQLGVLGWGETVGTIIGVRAPGQGRYSIADPRLQGERPRFNNVYRVVEWSAASQAVTGGEGPSAGGQAVADPRPATTWLGKGKYLVTEFDKPANTVIAASATGNGAYAVADPRTSMNRVRGDHYLTSRNYGVVRWDDPSGVVSAAASHDNGAFSLADPRALPMDAQRVTLPTPKERLVAIIQAIDGTWHRPFTTLELAALQGLVKPGEHLELFGDSDTAWRERIGNAVPPPAAKAVASLIGQTLLLAWSGETFILSDTPIWVQPIALALSVDEQHTDHYRERQ
jgi:site-specific DNA-cytosine methylase